MIYTAKANEIKGHISNISERIIDIHEKGALLDRGNWAVDQASTKLLEAIMWLEKAVEYNDD